MLQPANVADLPVAPPASLPDKPKALKIFTPKAQKMDLRKEKAMDLKVVTRSSAASKLLPEMVKDEAKEEKSSTPLLSDNNARCYAARYSDLKGAASLTHYATVGVSQGRLGNCAKELTNYEAQTYLETFPELSQKMGRDSKGAWDQARKHFEEIGYLNIHFSAAMKADSK